MSGTNLPLPQFYAQTLRALEPILDDTLPLSSPETQDLLSTSLDQLHLTARMINALGLFSENETADELGDGELVFMTVQWVIGECEGKGGLGGMAARKAAVERSETALTSFLSLLSSYSVLNSEEQAESSAAATSSGTASRDPAKRREAKIRQYRREKELREQLSALAPDHPSPSSSPIVFILSLLPSPPSRPLVASLSTGQSSTSVNPESDPPEKRDLALLLLRLLHTLALSTLQTSKQELELLASAPSESLPPSLDPRDTRRAEADDTWRLDRGPAAQAKPRELISGGGRVLRPFTILPSTGSLSDRERLRGEVFRNSHRLPTMTIDEYLEEEQRRGNIITGGGQASADAPTTSELLALAAENDGTMDGDAKAEEKRLKDEKWAQYADSHKKGEGNTMNRG